MKKEKRSILPGAALAALVAAVIVYCIMLNVEKNALSGYEKGKVLTAAAEIPAGTVFTAETAGEYFQEQELEKTMIPDGAVTDAAKLEGQMAATTLSRGTVATETLFQDLNAAKEEMREPVTAGFKADDLYQVASGILRSGDRIHIYTVDAETGDAYLIWEEVYVQAVFDNAGAVIAPDDRTTAAQRINILLEKDNVEQFYSELTSGSLRAVKAEG